jgi:ribosomal protein S12
MNKRQREVAVKMLRDRGNEPGIRYKIINTTGLTMSEVGDLERELKRRDEGDERSG